MSRVRHSNVLVAGAVGLIAAGIAVYRQARALGHEGLASPGWGIRTFAVVILSFYYGAFRPRLPIEDVLRMERIRLGMGLPALVLQGGVVEEAVFRWGAMTVLAWIGTTVNGAPSTPLMWLAIAGAAVIFGLAHLPGAGALGMRRTRALIGWALVLNGWLGLVCGWLYWRHGLIAAMLAHGVVHVVWHPLDHHMYRRAHHSRTCVPDVQTERRSEGPPQHGVTG